MFNLRIVSLKVALLASTCVATTAYAQDNEAEDEDSNVIVVTGEVSTFGATKSEAPIAETPRSVSVITADDFLDRGALTLSNTLNYTSGVTGNAFGISTRGDSATIRGLAAPEYQDNLQVQFGFFNNARADVYTLEQVEVLRGPASVLYGQAAPGGIVNTVSKVASPDHLGTEIVFTGGNFDRYQGAVDIGVDLSGDGQFTARFVGVYRESDTQIDFVEDDALVIAPSLTFDNGRTSITALFNYTDRDGDTDSQFLPLAVTACQSDQVSFSDRSVCANAPAQAVDNSVYVGDPAFNRFDAESTTFSIFATHDFSDALRFEGVARYRENEAIYQQAWISFLGDGVPRVGPDGSAAFRSIFGGPAGSTQYAFDTRLRGNFSTGPITHEVLAGLNYQDVETFTDQAFLRLPTPFNILNPVYDLAGFPTDAEFEAAQFFQENETVATDLYLIDRMTVGERLILDLGIRYSSVDSRDAGSDQTDEEFPITAGALYRTDIGLNPYVSFAQSFRATVGTDVISGTPLLPRRGEQLEIGLKYQPPGTANYISIAYYDLEEDNLVDFRANGQTQPGLTIRAEGVEVEALLNFGDFSFDFDFRHQEAEEVDEDGVALPRPSEPDTAASLWAVWQPSAPSLTGLRIGAGVRYASENESNGVFRIVTDGYTVFDALIGYDFGNGIAASLNARNLFNKDYFATCLSRGDCFPAEQRTIVGTLGFRF